MGAGTTVTAATAMEVLANQIRKSAERCKGSEVKLQGEIDGHLRESLAKLGVDYDPQVNQTPQRSLSSFSGKRPDSLFGHVVLDYKRPGVLSSAVGLRAAKKQVLGYLKSAATVAGRLEVDEAQKWVGIITDGERIDFAAFNGIGDWEWTPVREINAQTVSTLVQYYRALYKKPLDPHLLSKEFGRDTDVAKQCIAMFVNYLQAPTGRTKMLFKEWKRIFEQVSTYELSQLPALADWAKTLGVKAGTDAASLLFALHTYYALVVKLLTAELLSASRRFEEESFLDRLEHCPTEAPFLDELRRLEYGEVYRDNGIINFLEGDFFLWYLEHFDAELHAALRQVVAVFRQFEPATPKLSPARCTDLLKVFYTQVIDDQIRHDLGEFYTPDWLADLVLDRVGYVGQMKASVLDPACGSGTFLVSVIRRALAKASEAGVDADELIERITTQVKGFDLNPLAVISARANFLLAISELLDGYGKDIELPVYLSDCINVPVEMMVKDVPCLVYTLDTEKGERNIALPSSIVTSGAAATILTQAEADVRTHLPAGEFLANIRETTTGFPDLSESEGEVLADFYNIILELERNDWDEIWCRIIKNQFAPRAIAEVDYVVGNPPWVRWSRLPSKYRSRCKQFCNFYGLVSGRGYAGGIETDISTVVTFSAADNWLKDNGLLGFLITAPVFKSDSATGFRKFTLPNGERLRPTSIDDLVSLKPFRDAENETALVVLRKEKAGASRKLYPKSGIPYTVWKRKDNLPIQPWYPLSKVKKNTTRRDKRAVPVAEPGTPLFTGTKADISEVAKLRGKSAYLTAAHKGTTTDLSGVYWVKVLDYDAKNDRARIATLAADEFSAAGRVTRTNSKWIEGSLVFPLIRGRDIGRFCHDTDGWYIVVPNRHYEEMDTEAEFRKKHPKAHEYFSKYKEALKARSSYKRYQAHLPFYAIYDVGKYTFSKFKVVWMEQQDPTKFRACVISSAPASSVKNKLYVPDHKLYMLSTNNEHEAHYVCGVLNSGHARRFLGGFLVGKQIGTSIFRYMGVPAFDSENKSHLRIAEISKAAHQERGQSNSTADLASPIREELDGLVEKVF